MLVGKECKDALRRTQRLLRDEFTARARSLQQSTAAALLSAQRARELDPKAQAARRELVAREMVELGSLAQAVPAGAAPGPAPDPS